MVSLTESVVKGRWAYIFPSLGKAKQILTLVWIMVSVFSMHRDRYRWTMSVYLDKAIFTLVDPPTVHCRFCSPKKHQSGWPRWQAAGETNKWNFKVWDMTSGPGNICVYYSPNRAPLRCMYQKSRWPRGFALDPGEGTSEECWQTPLSLSAPLFFSISLTVYLTHSICYNCYASWWRSSHDITDTRRWWEWCRQG